ncbi:hypothetical protein F5J12DRAFT_837112 [Pisolithus orientalis]|uniref:uncharacterized protein n=1 Tax=Pisolithus orientalis TaxID=936130 RepID=UPI0022247F5B|nr:uncharacterized protein F5J12DRAFT_837112 [Pisolithus orientalis]KAI6004466.1 hypothetical protein F5J12DRAFT_837112 [Pisolithus orientalis]
MTPPVYPSSTMVVLSTVATHAFDKSCPYLSLKSSAAVSTPNLLSQRSARQSSFRDIQWRSVSRRIGEQILCGPGLAFDIKSLHSQDTNLHVSAPVLTQGILEVMFLSDGPAISENITYPSIFDLRCDSNVRNKFRTVRSVTTEATSLSLEVTSFTRTDVSSLAASGRDGVGIPSASRKRRKNNACGPSSRNTHRDKPSELQLNKGIVRPGDGKCSHFCCCCCCHLDNSSHCRPGSSSQSPKGARVRPIHSKLPLCTAKRMETPNPEENYKT